MLPGQTYKLLLSAREGDCVRHLDAKVKRTSLHCRLLFVVSLTILISLFFVSSTMARLPISQHRDPDICHRHSLTRDNGY